LTLLVSVPSGVFFLDWLATLRGGAIRFRAPMLFALGSMAVFATGGLSGMFLGTASTDVYLHDTAFVVGHFHLVMAASVLLGTFAAVHFWFPLAFGGRVLSERLGRVHFAATFVLLCATFGAMLALGWAGVLRRTYDPTAHAYAAHTAGLNRAV